MYIALVSSVIVLLW